MEQYLALVYAGFTGSVTMITCTVLALTRLVFEYKGGSPEVCAFSELSAQQLQLSGGGMSPLFQMPLM